MNHSPLTEERILCSLEQYSFSDEAASLVRAEHPQLQMQYAPNIQGVWKSIEEGGLGMIPLENSSGGVVWPHLEKLMRAQELQIAAAVRLQIRICAGGVAGANLRNATHVHSHPKGLEQCSRFIDSLQLKAEREECDSTVAAVKGVADMQTDLQDGTHIALASRLAIEALGLEVLAEDIADLPGEQNVTKFLVIHKNGGQQLPLIHAAHHAALITPKKEGRGVLAGILNQIGTSGINLHSIHSRSIGPKDYTFFMEMEREGTPEEMGVLAQWLQHSSLIQSSKWLGSWNEEYANI